MLEEEVFEEVVVVLVGMILMVLGVSGSGLGVYDLIVILLILFFVIVNY